MMRTRAQRLRATVKEDGWAELPDELVEKVLELLQAGGQAGGLSFSQASATVRLVCAAWKAVYDALVKRLMLRGQTTDEAMGMLARRFPAVASLEMQNYEVTRVLTDAGVRSVSSLTALTSLNIGGCCKLTDEGMLAVSNLHALTSLDLTWCHQVTDEGMRAVSSLPALAKLTLNGCREVTVRGVSSCTSLTSLAFANNNKLTDDMRAVSSLSALTSLSLSGCFKLTDEALQAVSSLPALTFLDLFDCEKVTAAGVKALRSTTAAPSLDIEWFPVEDLSD
jgi:hypothetical protein